MTVRILGEVFDFLAWKVREHYSFYVRRSDGELRIVELRGALLPARVTRFRCEFGDGTTIGFNSCRFLLLSLSEIPQIQNVFQESSYSRKRKSAGKGGKRTSAVSAKRAAAGRKHAKVTNPRDRTKIKVAFFRRVNSRLNNIGISNSAAAREIAELMCDDNNPLELENSPYYVSPDTVKRIAKAR